MNMEHPSRCEGFLGVARVNLEVLRYEAPSGRPSIPLQRLKLEHLESVFHKKGCQPGNPENRVRAKISRSLLNKSLLISDLNENELQQDSSPKVLKIPEGSDLRYFHGQHRIEAGKAFGIDYWDVVLLDQGL